jgi:phosphoribosylformylglycinamidine cyclo-ligase
MGRIDREEMHRVFNMGIGLVMAVAPAMADSIIRRLAVLGDQAWVIGEMVTAVSGHPQVEYVGTDGSH